jgi:hypothetical protein
LRALLSTQTEAWGCMSTCKRRARHLRWLHHMPSAERSEVACTREEADRTSVNGKSAEQLLMSDPHVFNSTRDLRSKEVYFDYEVSHSLPPPPSLAMAKRPTTSSAALLFMRRCRQPILVNSRASSSSESQSPYAPSAFNKPYKSPMSEPSPLANLPSNLPLNPPRSQGQHGALGPVPSFLQPPPDKRTPSWARPQARPTPIPPPVASRTSFGNYLRRQLGLPIPSSAEIPVDPFTVHSNPYRAHKRWPPDLSSLSSAQQLHFEKTYRRRTKLKWARPVFKRWLTLVQNTLILGVVLYMVLVHEYEEGMIFDWLRARMWGYVAASELLPDRVRTDATEKKKKYELKWEGAKEEYFQIVPVPNIKTTGAPDPEEEKIPWAQRKRRAD